MRRARSLSAVLGFGGVIPAFKRRFKPVENRNAGFFRCGPPLFSGRHPFHTTRSSLTAVSEVFWDSSRVISPTSFGREYDVVLEGSKTAVTAVGAGNRELWIRLPREFPVAEGERVLTVGTHRYVVGVVARIVGETSSAIKEARIRQPLNVRSLLDVYVVE